MFFCFKENTGKENGRPENKKKYARALVWEREDNKEKRRKDDWGPDKIFH